MDRKSNLITIFLILIINSLNVSGICQTKDSNLSKFSAFNKEKDDIAVVKHYVDFGTGIGQDYGGVTGVKLTVLPIPNFGIFGIAGVNFVGFSWNIGVVWNLLPSTSQYHIRPNAKLMYGVNGTTRVTLSTLNAHSNQYDKAFKGITPGLGLEFMFGDKKVNGIDLDLGFPIHGKDYKDQVDFLNSDPNVDEIVKTWAVTVSIGYHHEF